MKTRIAETTNYIFLIKEEEQPIPIGAFALHKSDIYRMQYPTINHLTICNQDNQSSIQEHWREVVGHLPKVGADILDGIPLIK